MLAFELFEVLLPLLEILFRAGHLLGLVVEHDEVAVLEVEAVQLVARLLGVHDILVDYEGGTLSVVRYALADLASETCQYVKYCVWLCVGYVPDRPKFAE